MAQHVLNRLLGLRIKEYATAEMVLEKKVGFGPADERVQIFGKGFQHE
ncbi:MAG: hypothetical protein ACRECY_01190 [Phyllobacterium sp.]